MKHFLFLVVALFSSVLNATILHIRPESVEAASWMIYDPQSKQVLAEHQSHAQRAPASLTKMMVAYIALKEIKAGKLKTTDILTTTDVVKTVQPDESQMFLKSGQAISVDQLLAGLIIMSANDAAVTLADHLGHGVPHFIEMMNQEAQALGMTDTYFTNPAGITMMEHHSSAADMVKLSTALIEQYPDYLGYSKQQQYQFNQFSHAATNLLLKKDTSVDGLKTGYTSAAGYNLALTAKRADRRLIVVVMGTKSALKRAEVAYDLMNMAYNYTHNQVILQPNQRIAQIPVHLGKQPFFNVLASKQQMVTTSLYSKPENIDMRQYNPATNQLPVLPDATNRFDVDTELLHTQLEAPVNQSMHLATIQIKQNGEVIQHFPIEMNVQVEKLNFFERCIAWFKALFSSSSQKTTEAVVFPLK